MDILASSKSRQFDPLGSSSLVLLYCSCLASIRLPCLSQIHRAIPIEFSKSYFLHSGFLSSVPIWQLRVGRYLVRVVVHILRRTNKSQLKAIEPYCGTQNSYSLATLRRLQPCCSWASCRCLSSAHAGLEAMFSSNSGLYLLIAGFVWSPLIFRHLK